MTSAVNLNKPAYWFFFCHRHHSITRVAAGASRFLTLTQSAHRPDLYGPIAGTLSVQSLALRENTRTRSSSRRAMKRKPLCLISNSQRDPSGHDVRRGRQAGLDEPGGRRTSEPSTEQ